MISEVRTDTVLQRQTGTRAAGGKELRLSHRPEHRAVAQTRSSGSHPHIYMSLWASSKQAATPPTCMSQAKVCPHIKTPHNCKKCALLLMSDMHS